MRKIIIILVLNLIITLFISAQDIKKFDLDKYQWVEADTLKHISVRSDFRNKDDFYKIVYHIKGNDAVLFDVFEYDGQFFFDCKMKQEKFDTIPVIAPKNISNYEKMSNSKDIVGVYKFNDADIDYFEIKKVCVAPFCYEIFLGYSNSGHHLIRIQDNKYVSDSTFGVWKNILYKNIFDADRSEWFYLSRDFYEKLDDRFNIFLSNYDLTYKKLTVVTETEQYSIFPKEFFIQEGGAYNFYWDLNLYEQASFSSKKDELTESQIIIVLEKKEEWVMNHNKNTMWFKVQLTDSRIGWILGTSLAVNRKNIKYSNKICNDYNVRVRSKPNLSGTVLELLNKGDEVKVEKHSIEKFEIDGESWYWYKIKSDEIPRGEGWVYGKYLDIEE